VYAAAQLPPALAAAQPPLAPLAPTTVISLPSQHGPVWSATKEAEWCVAVSLEFTVLAGTTTATPWLMSPQDLERQGYAFVSSLSQDLLFIVDPTGGAHALDRRADGIPIIRGFSPRRGLFCAGKPSPGMSVTVLYIIADTAAAMPVAGGRYETILDLGTGPGRSAVGVGEQVVPSVASGTQVEAT
jgi:hypothetical protein